MSKQSGCILIAGAGCAGLSLAMHLIRSSNLKQNIVLVEPRFREEYTNDRTWSGFATKPHLFSGLATSRWHRWKCRTPNGEHISESERYPYESVRASDYYDLCFDQLASDPRVEMYFGCRLVNGSEGMFDILDGSNVLLRSIKPDHLFDSRPQSDSYFSGNLDDVALWQQFSGVEIETSHDAFDPDVVTLMDFSVDQDKAIRFVYVLPFSMRRALIEFTVFSPLHLSLGQLRAEVEKYVDREYGEADWIPVGYESGRIPMVTSEIASNSSNNTTRIGLSGGLARPSTGYAFSAIHEHSRQIVKCLERNRPIANRKQGSVSKILDRIFLSFLAKNPQKSSELFLRISQRTNPDRYARFLMDTSSVLDKLAVIVSMPKVPFILEAWQARRIWLARRSASNTVRGYRLKPEGRS